MNGTSTYVTMSQSLPQICVHVFISSILPLRKNLLGSKRQITIIVHFYFFLDLDFPLC